MLPGLVGEMEDSAPPEKKKRLADTTIACPIVFGSMAFWLGKKAAEQVSHRWTLFVRGPNDEDLSVFVSKIIFSLHPSFAAPVREIVEPPFEVTEVGWGEFEAGIRIFFKDGDEKPVDIVHMIRLYPDNGQQPTSTKKPVVKEFYDEIVFTNPSPSFRAMLMQYVPPDPRPITWLTEHYTTFSEETDLQKLMSVQDYLAQHLDAAKAKLLRQEAELGHLQSVAPPAPPAPPSASTAPAPTNPAPKKKEGKAEKAEREKAEKEKLERDKVAAAKKRAANNKAKKEKAERERLMKEKAKAAAAATATTTSSST